MEHSFSGFVQVEPLVAVGVYPGFGDFQVNVPRTRFVDVESVFRVGGTLRLGSVFAEGTADHGRQHVPGAGFVDFYSVREITVQNASGNDDRDASRTAFVNPHAVFVRGGEGRIGIVAGNGTVDHQKTQARGRIRSRSVAAAPVVEMKAVPAVSAQDHVSQGNDLLAGRDAPGHADDDAASSGVCEGNVLKIEISSPVCDQQVGRTLLRDLRSFAFDRHVLRAGVDDGGFQLDRTLYRPKPDHVDRSVPVGLADGGAESVRPAVRGVGHDNGLRRGGRRKARRSESRQKRKDDQGAARHEPVFSSGAGSPKKTAEKFP